MEAYRTVVGGSAGKTPGLSFVSFLSNLHSRRISRGALNAANMAFTEWKQFCPVTTGNKDTLNVQIICTTKARGLSI